MLAHLTRCNAGYTVDGIKARRRGTPRVRSFFPFWGQYFFHVNELNI